MIFREPTVTVAQGSANNCHPLWWGSPEEKVICPLSFLAAQGAVTSVILHS